MSARRIWALLRKDLVDALRDGRVVIALVLPIALAVIYNATAPERGERPDAEVAVVAQTGDVAAALRGATRRSVDLRVVRARSEVEARRLVADGDVDLAVVAPGVRPGVAGDVRARVLLGDDTSAAAQSVAAVAPDALTAAAGRRPAVAVAAATVPQATEGRPAADLIEPRVLFIAGSVVLLAGFVALLVVPLQTAEELETGTFGALRMAMPTSEVLAAKALGGALYGLVGTAIVVLITRAAPRDVVAFVAAAVLLVVSLTGFGLLLGLLSRNANQINTYSSFLLLPVAGLAVAVLFVTGGALDVVLDVLPFSQAMKLLVDALADDPPFREGVVPWLVVLAWAVAGLVAVRAYAGRREV